MGARAPFHCIGSRGITPPKVPDYPPQCAQEEELEQVTNRESEAISRALRSAQFQEVSGVDVMLLLW